MVFIGLGGGLGWYDTDDRSRVPDRPTFSLVYLTPPAFFLFRHRLRGHEDRMLASVDFHHSLSKRSIGRHSMAIMKRCLHEQKAFPRLVLFALYLSQKIQTWIIISLLHAYNSRPPSFMMGISLQILPDSSPDE